MIKDIRVTTPEIYNGLSNKSLETLYFVSDRIIRWTTTIESVSAKTIYTWDLTGEKILDVDKEKINITILGMCNTHGFDSSEVIFAGYSDYIGKASEGLGAIPYWSGNTFNLSVDVTCFGIDPSPSDYYSVSAIKSCTIILEAYND